MASQSQLDKLKAVVPFAQQCERQYGVPASITLAQWILESGWGSSELTLKANNCFGIKYSQERGTEHYMEFPTAEYVAGKRVVIDADFVDYVEVDRCFEDHAELLAYSAHYHAAMRVANNPSQFAAALQECGYSTNPHYASELMQLVTEHNLTQYDVLPPDEPAAQMEKAA